MGIRCETARAAALGCSPPTFGYYLVTAVLAYVLWRQLRPRNPLIADLSHGHRRLRAGRWGSAAILAMVWPTWMHAYTDGAAVGQALIATQFATVLQVVWRAIRQFLDTILLAAWWLGIGWPIGQDHLRRSACRWCSPLRQPPCRWIRSRRRGTGLDLTGRIGGPAGKAGLAFEALSVSAPRSIKSCERGGNRTWTG
jgi:hypothetical protein